MIYRINKRSIQCNYSLASMQFGVDSVHATNLNVQYINDQPLGTILTKYFPRNITWPVLAEYVITDQPINVQGTVNRMNLPTEYENTLMVSFDKHTNGIE